MKVLLDAIAAPRDLRPYSFLCVYGAFAYEGLGNQFLEPKDNSLTSNGALPIEHVLIWVRNPTAIGEWAGTTTRGHWEVDCGV